MGIASVSLMGLVPILCFAILLLILRVCHSHILANLHSVTQFLVIYTLNKGCRMCSCKFMWFVLISEMEVQLERSPFNPHGGVLFAGSPLRRGFKGILQERLSWGGPLF